MFGITKSTTELTAVARTPLCRYQLGLGIINVQAAVIVVVCFEVTIGEFMPYRLAPCDLGDPGWGDPWFPHGVFVASLTFWYGLVILMFFLLFLLPYHVEMIQCYHLLHELAHELAPVTPRVGGFLFFVLLCFVWGWFVFWFLVFGFFGGTS